MNSSNVSKEFATEVIGSKMTKQPPKYKWVDCEKCGLPYKLRVGRKPAIYDCGECNRE